MSSVVGLFRIRADLHHEPSEAVSLTPALHSSTQARNPHVVLKGR